MKFLGHVVGSGIHAPNTDKVAAIQNLETPKSTKDVRSILDLRSYVYAFSDIACPLIELIKKRAPNEITRSEQNFRQIKTFNQQIINLLYL